MSPQEVFDTVVKAIIAQGKPPFDSSTDKCYYRGPNGTKCAAGFLIPDDQYNPDFEGRRISAIFSDVPALSAEVGYESIGLLDSLQVAHDTAARTSNSDADFLTTFRKHAGYAAESRGLNAAAIKA